MHRTVSSTAQSAINTAKRLKGRTGFHIVIDNSGETTQIVNFGQRANHVGKAKGDASNFNSIGVEVVGNYNPETKGWDKLTPAQVESTAQAVHKIMEEYGIGIDNVLPHENASWKTPGEGGVVLDAIKPRVEELIKEAAKSKAE